MNRLKAKRRGTGSNAPPSTITSQQVQTQQANPPQYNTEPMTTAAVNVQNRVIQQHGMSMSPPQIDPRDASLVRDMCRLLKHTLSIDTTVRSAPPPTSDDQGNTPSQIQFDGTTTTPSPQTLAGTQPQLSRRKKVEMLDTACAVLDMMFRKSIVKADHWRELISLLVYVCKYCAICRDQVAEVRKRREELVEQQAIAQEKGGGDGDDESRDSTHQSSKHGQTLGPNEVESEGVIAIRRSIQIFLHFSRISSARTALANTPGLLEVLVDAINSGDEALTPSKVNAILCLAYLADSSDNMMVMGRVPGLVDTLLNAADPDSGVFGTFLDLGDSREAREQAARATMNLTSCERNQAFYLTDGTVIDTLMKLMGVDDNANTRGYAAACFGNLAQVPTNVEPLIEYGGDGRDVVVTALVQKTSDENDTVTEYSIEALRNLSAEIASRDLPVLSDLIRGLGSVISSRTRSIDTKIVAASTLKKLSSCVQWQSLHHETLFLAVTKSLVPSDPVEVYSLIGQSIMLLLQQATIVLNRPALLNADLFDCLSELSSCMNAAVTSNVLMTLECLPLDNAENHGALTCPGFASTMAYLISTSGGVHNHPEEGGRDTEHDYSRQDDEGRDAGLRMMKRLGVTPSVRRSMRENEHLMMSLTKLSLRAESEDVREKARDVMMLLLMSTEGATTVGQEI